MDEPFPDPPSWFTSGQVNICLGLSDFGLFLSAQKPSPNFTVAVNWSPSLKPLFRTSRPQREIPPSPARQSWQGCMCVRDCACARVNTVNIVSIQLSCSDLSPPLLVSSMGTASYNKAATRRRENKLVEGTLEAG